MVEVKLRVNILLSLQSALLDEVPSTLRGVTVGWDSSKILIHCFFDGEIQEKDRESMEIVATEVQADFLKHKVQVECIRKDIAENLNPYTLMKWVYHRREPMIIQ